MPIISKEKVNDVNAALEEMARSVQELTDHSPGIMELIKKIQEHAMKLKEISMGLITSEFEDIINALAENNNQFSTLVTTAAEALRALVDSIEEAQ